jgi:hypothetical protein
MIQCNFLYRKTRRSTRFRLPSAYCSTHFVKDYCRRLEAKGSLLTFTQGMAGCLKGTRGMLALRYDFVMRADGSARQLMSSN